MLMIKRLPEKVHCDFPGPSAGIKLSHPFRQCSNLPPQMRVEIKKLSGPRSRPFLTQLLVAWIIILSAIALACHFQAWWMTVLAILIVASRQNVLGLLVHDQAHKLGLRGEMGDKFTNLFAAYPILVLTVENYAKVHLAHHKYYFTDKDPDHLRKSGNEWQVPKSKIELFRLFARDLSGLSTYKLIRGKTTSLNSEEFGRTTPKLMRPIFFLTIISVLTFFHLWPIFLLYWLLPGLTIFQLIVRWGALTEHIYNTPGMKVEENSPLIIPTWINRLLLPNLNFSYHPYHHWHPYVSFSNLPKVHSLYLKCGLVDEERLFRGYRAFLKFILLKDHSTNNIPGIVSL